MTQEVSLALIRSFSAFRRHTLPTQAAVRRVETAVFSTRASGPSWRLGWSLAAVATAAAVAALLLVPSPTARPPAPTRGGPALAVHPDAGPAPVVPLDRHDADGSVEVLAVRGVSEHSVKAEAARIEAVARACGLRGEFELRLDRLGRLAGLDAKSDPSSASCAEGKLAGLRLEPTGANRAGTDGGARVRLRIR